MAQYTQSVREILQFNKRANENLLNISDVYAIANRSLFSDAPINVLDADYRERFVTGFALHFMNEELGYETLPLWKIALNEKLFNNGTYINKIFANLDKEIFAQYNVKQVESEGTTAGTKEGTGSLSSEREIEKSATDTTVKDASDVLTLNTTETLDADGTSNLTRSGVETRAKTGTDTLTKSGTETKAKTGNDSLAKTGTETDTESGNTTTTDENFEDKMHSGATSNDVNGASFDSDTPMGQLSALRTPGGPVAETSDTDSDSSVYPDDSELDINPRALKEYDRTANGSNYEGYDYEQHQTVNYASAAHEEGQTSQGTENSNDQSYNKSYNDVEHGKVNTKTFAARTDTTTYGSNEATTFTGRSDATLYGSTETTTYGSNGAQRTDNTTTTDDETKTRQGTESREIDDTTTDTSSASSTDALSQSTENSESTTGSHEDTVNQTDYSINYEMLYKSIPLLNKVWEIFDDLFMQIF